MHNESIYNATDTDITDSESQSLGSPFSSPVAGCQENVSSETAPRNQAKYELEGWKSRKFGNEIPFAAAAHSLTTGNNPLVEVRMANRSGTKWSVSRVAIRMWG